MPELLCNLCSTYISTNVGAGCIIQQPGRPRIREPCLIACTCFSALKTTVCTMQAVFCQSCHGAARHAWPYLSPQRQINLFNCSKLDHRPFLASYTVIAGISLVHSSQSSHPNNFFPFLHVLSIIFYCVINVRNVWNHMQIAVLSAPWKLAALRRTCFSSCCNVKRRQSAANSHAGRTYIIVDIMSALCRVTLRPERNCLHLNREYAVVNNLMALAFIVFFMVSLCNVSIKDSTDIFTCLINWISCPSVLQYSQSVFCCVPRMGPRT